MNTNVLLSLGGVVVAGIVMITIATNIITTSGMISAIVTEDFLANNTTYVPLSFAPITTVTNVTNNTVLVPPVDYTVNNTNGSILVTNGSYNNQILRIIYV